MNIRKATDIDFKRVMEIYDTARAFMADTGNPHQWGDDGYPASELIKTDIKQQQLYVVCEGDSIEGVFMFGKGPEESYLEINGRWLNDEPYYVIHRIASSGRQKGILKAATEFALSHSGNIKMDTYIDNTVMQKALSKLGFKHCGTVYIKTSLSRNSPRMAYQLTADT